MSVRAALVVAAALLASACASLPPSTLPALPESYAERQTLLQRYDRWQVRGRVAVRTPDDGFSASLAWRQEGKHVAARLHGPLGRGTVLLDGNPRRLTLTHGDGLVEVHDDPEFSLRQRYGWTVPVQSFRFWVLGIADPALPGDFDIDETGRLRALSQGRWSVEYRDYQRVGGGELPRRLVATSDNVRLTIVLKAWEIPLTDASASR